MQAVEWEPDRVPEDHLLEADARAEAQRARAQPADRPRRDLDDRHLVAECGLVDSDFRVDRSLGEPDRASRPFARAGDEVEGRRREARRRHVDGLLEVRALERVGLVEDRQDLELPVPEQPFERDLDARHVLLDEDRPVPEGGDPGPGRGELLGGVAADHTLAARQPGRLHDAREPGRAGVGAEAGLGHLAGVQASAHLGLVARRRDRVGWAVWEPEPGPGLGRHDHAPVVHGDHGVDAPPAVEVVDHVEGSVHVVEGDRGDVIVVTNRGCVVRTDHELDPQGLRGRDEVGRAVRGRGHEEKHPGHGRIMVHMADPAALLTLTDPARERILEVRAGEPEPDTLALWLEINGVQGNAFTYDMYFRKVDEAGEQDVVQHGDDLSVVVPEEHAENVRGSTLDLSGGGLVLQNPNTPPLPSAVAAAAAPDLDMDDPVVAKIVEVLDAQINPQIAAHGGFAELVAVDAPIAYLRMGGGCQGCGMAAVTLSQGIEVLLLDLVPEITELVDVTDHASGTNPYYEAAKK